MGRAKIENKIGEGKYRIEYLYNVELINFEIERLKLRRSDIDPNELWKATQEYETKQTATRHASDALKVLLQQLRGLVSPDVITQLDIAVSSLSTADTTLGQASNQRSNAGIALNASVGAFPSSPPAEVTAAYTAAFNALGDATTALTEENRALSDSLTATQTASNEAGVPNPDPDTVRAEIQTARDTFAALLAAGTTAAAALVVAGNRVRSAAGSLPGDSSWDTARGHAENADFALTNSDEEAGQFGATTLHGQVTTSYTTAKTALDEAANLMTSGQPETKEEVKKAVKALSDAYTEAGKAKLALDSLYLELSQLNKRIAELEAVDKSKLLNVWCADYSLEIEEAKEVGTIEVPGEYTKKGEKGEILIRPGFQPARLAWNNARDGFVTPSQALTAAGVYYNLAMLPGWQTFRPTYRFAKVRKINEDGTLDILLSIDDVSHRSSQQDLIIDPKSLPGPNNPTKEPNPVDYTKVPVQYMDCDAGAFEVDDEVLVEYEGQKAEKPKVIGFRKDPRECGPVRFYTPREELRVPRNAWARIEMTGQVYGNCYWSGRAGALSWWGPPTRFVSGVAQGVMDLGLSTEIYRRGKLLAVAPGLVLGAALCLDPGPQGDRWLIVVCGGVSNLGESFYAKNLDIPRSNWVLLHDEIYSSPDNYKFDTFFVSRPWYFSNAGTQGVSVKPIGEKPNGADIQTRMVHFVVEFLNGRPFGKMTFLPMRHPTGGWSYPTPTDTLGGLGQLGINGEYHERNSGEGRKFDVYADFVGETLVTFDEISSGYSSYDITCGAAITGLQSPYVNIRARNVHVKRVQHSESTLICDALGISFFLSSFTTDDDTTYVVTNDPDAPIYTITSNFTQTSRQENFSWMDFTGGTGKFHRVSSDNSTINSSHGQIVERYVYDPNLGYPVRIIDSEESTGVITVTNARTLYSGEVVVNLGSATGAGSNQIFNQQQWACADRRGHCLVASEFFNKKVGVPVLPQNVLPTFEMVGVG